MRNYFILGAPIFLVVSIAVYAATPPEVMGMKTDKTVSTGTVSTGTADIKNSKGALSLKSILGGVEVQRITTKYGRSNLKEGDVIIKLAGRHVQTPEEIMRYVRTQPKLAVVGLSVNRGNTIVDIDVDADLFQSFMTPKPPKTPS